MTLINRVIATTTLLAFLLSPLLLYFYGFEAVLGFTAGASWALLNFYLIKLLVKKYLAVQSRDYISLAGWMIIKFPVLYGLGFLLLKIEYWPVLAVIAGLSLAFLVMLGVALVGTLRLGFGERYG